MDYLPDNSNDDKIWHNSLDHDDIDHDFTAAPSITSKNSALYTKCMEHLFPIKPEPPVMFFDLSPKGESIAYNMYMEPLTLPFYGPGYPKPAQLDGLNFAIHDTFPGREFGLPDKITPSYYFDPATRTYTNQVGTTNWGNLNVFLAADRQKDVISLTKYGLDNVTIQFTNEPMGRGNPLLVTITYNGVPFYSVIDNNGFDVTTSSPPPYNNGGKTYIGGNPAKNKFFKDNANSVEPTILLDGIRHILCKLIGDLSHLMFASDTDVIFTNDTYLRDRAIYATKPVAYRDYLSKEDFDGLTVDDYNNNPIYHVKLNELKAKIENATAKSLAAKAKIKKPVKLTKVVKAARSNVKKNAPVQPTLTKKELGTLTRNQKVSIKNLYRSNVDNNNVTHMIIGGDPNVSIIYPNECNQKNLLNIIDSYIANVNAYVTDTKPGEKEVAYIVGLTEYLAGVAKTEIRKVDTKQSIDDYNEALESWFPLDIVFKPSFFNSDFHANKVPENAWLSTGINHAFPNNDVVPNEINTFDDYASNVVGFNGGRQENNNNTVFTLNPPSNDPSINSKEQQKPTVELDPPQNKPTVELDPHQKPDASLENMLAYFKKIDNTDNEILSKSGVVPINLHDSADFIDMIEDMITTSVTNEFNIMREYLLIICDNDVTKAYTAYTTLISATYFTGYNIYDYGILEGFVNAREPVNETESVDETTPVNKTTSVKGTTSVFNVEYNIQGGKRKTKRRSNKKQKGRTKRISYIKKNKSRKQRKSKKPTKHNKSRKSKK